MLDNRLITTSSISLNRDWIADNANEIVHIDFMLNGKPLSHSRPIAIAAAAAISDSVMTVPSLNILASLHLVYVDPMVNYFRSLSIAPTVNLHSLHGGDYFLRHPLDPPPAGRQELLELRSTRILSGERGRGCASVYEWPASTGSTWICCCRSWSSPAIGAAGWIRLFAPTRHRIENRTDHRLYFDNQLATLLKTRRRRPTAS